MPINNPPPSGGAMTLISARELLAAATSIDFTGLDLDATGSYLLICQMKNAAAAYNNVALFFNNDKNAAHYHIHYLYTAAALVAASSVAGSADAFQIPTSDRLFATINVSRNDVRGVAQVYSSFGATIKQELRSVSFDVAGNITQLTLTGDQANGFAIGTKVQLYKLTKV